jgi:hypothetical protein
MRRTLDSWNCSRRPIGKAEWTRGETNPRFIVTSLRALALREVALGPGHPAVETSLDNLAALYQAQGRLLSHFSAAF